MRTSKDWGEFCPNSECNEYGTRNQGNIRAIAIYETQSGRRRIFQCKACGKSFAETQGTIFFDLRTKEEKVLLAVKLRLKRMTITDIAEVLEVTEDTILSWLERAYRKSEEVNKYLLKNLHVTQVELDELWAFVRRKISKNAEADRESPPDAKDGRQWWWVSFASQTRLLLAVVVGPRCYQTALLLLQTTASIVSGIPVFFSDGLSIYKDALLAVYHKIIEFPRTGRPGRPRKPKLVPHPELAYGQIIKTHSKRSGLHVVRYVIWGAAKIAQLGLKISTSLLERLNLTLRQSLAPLARKSLAFAKRKENLQGLAYLFQAYYNWVRPHMSLAKLLLYDYQFKHGCIQRRWLPISPGMATGITNHVWSFKELLAFKIPPPPKVLLSKY